MYSCIHVFITSFAKIILFLDSAEWLQVDGTAVLTFPHVHYLSVTTDQNLSSNQHIKDITKTALFLPRNITHLRPPLCFLAAEFSLTHL